MVHSSFHLSAAMCLALAISAAPAAAQTAGGAANLSGGKVKVGVLTDIAGVRRAGPGNLHRMISGISA
jgi:branched-chain amino acid transport system substrate-binding protein